jgi:hypothetical protein
MKTRRFLITMIMVIAAGFFVNTSAQEALKAIAKKCETMENVDISVVISKDKETKKINSNMMRIEFNQNEPLKNEILAAFKKDRDDADNIAESKKTQNVQTTGKDAENKKIQIIQLTYRFDNIVYNVSIRGDNCTFSVTENNFSNNIKRSISIRNIQYI